MVYIFENENALELYYTITKEMGIQMRPKGNFEDDTVYMTEKWLMETINEIHQINDMNQKQ